MSGVFYQDRVFVLRPSSTTNRAGETVLSYAGLELATGFPRDRVQVRPTSQAELPREDRATAMSEWRLATEPGSGDWDIRSSDWIRLPDGTICEVQGDAARPSDPLTGGLDHVEVLVHSRRG